MAKAQESLGVPSDNWFVSELRWGVVGHEGDFRWAIALVDQERKAKEIALKNVDDATRNPIYVWKRTQLGWEIVGHAYFGGDGGSYWREGK